MSSRESSIVGDVRVKAIYRFDKHHGKAKTRYNLKALKGSKCKVLDKKIVDRVYLVKPSYIDANPKPLYALGGNKGHITSLYQSSKDHSSSILTGDLGRDLLKDILLVVLSDDKESLVIYHIVSDRIIKDALELAIVSLFSNGYFMSDISNLENQYYFDFMLC